jgi:hypothetical protein
MYNRLKTLVNKIRSYESTRWMDHDVVRLMLRSFTVIDPHLVNLIRENPRYTKMTPEEILGKFISECMMVKEARYVNDALNGSLPLHESQPVALKATSSKEALPSKQSFFFRPIFAENSDISLLSVGPDFFLCRPNISVFSREC